MRLPCKLTSTHRELQWAGLYTVRWISSNGDMPGARFSKQRDNSLIITDLSKEDTEYNYYCTVTRIGSDDLHGNYPRSGPKQLHLLGELQRRE